MLSISIVLLRVCSAYAYCYCAYAQYKHSNKSKMREIYEYAERTRSNIMLRLSICVVTICVVTICACWAYAQSKKYAKRWLSLRIVSYLIEYLSKFEFLFKTVLGYLSGDQMGSFEAKKTESKISCLGTFKGIVLCRDMAPSTLVWRVFNVHWPRSCLGKLAVCWW